MRARLKTKTIEFRLREDMDPTVFGFPRPGGTVVPKWYKDMPMYTNGDTKANLHPGNASPKACVPVLDSITSGYYYVTPYDIEVAIDPAHVKPRIDWNFPGTGFVSSRNEDLGGMMPTPEGYHPGFFVWSTPYQIITPKGYSVLVTHPLNNFDVPFITASGIMDSDGYGHSGALPFYLKKGFEGIIPAGTPYAQVIPIKREDWKSHNSELPEDMRLSGYPRAFTRGWYRDNIWIKKSYK